MGQGYIIVNDDDKQYFYPYFAGSDVGSKFLEFWDEPTYAQAMAILTCVGQGLGGGDLHIVDPLVGGWYGNSIATLGEYASYSGVTQREVTAANSGWTNIGPALVKIIALQEQLGQDRVALGKFLGKALQREYADIFSEKLPLPKAKKIFLLTNDDMHKYVIIGETLQEPQFTYAFYAAGAALRRWRTVGVLRRESEWRSLSKLEKDATKAAFLQGNAADIERIDGIKKILASIKRKSDTNKTHRLREADLALLASIRNQLTAAVARADLFNLTVPLGDFGNSLPKAEPRQQDEDADDNDDDDDAVASDEEFITGVFNLIDVARARIKQIVTSQRPAMQAINRAINQTMQIIRDLQQIITRNNGLMEIFETTDIAQLIQRLFDVERLLAIDQLEGIEKFVPTKIRARTEFSDVPAVRKQQEEHLANVQRAIDDLLRPAVAGFANLLAAVRKEEEEEDRIRLVVTQPPAAQPQEKEAAAQPPNPKRPAESSGEDGDDGSKKPRIECELCGSDGTWTCAGCDDVYYCSSACQREHWTSGHAKVCAGKE